MKKRAFLALLLALCLLLGTLPMAVADTTCTQHVRTQKTTQEPTCTENGWYIGVCAICGAQLDNGGTIPALGHNWQFEVLDQPSCTTSGYGVDICTRCGDYRDNGRSIDALGHNYQRKVVQEATCTTDGMAVYTCSRCGDSYREPIPATGHKWGAWVDGDPATCVQYGNRYHQCTRCGQKEWERNYAGGLGDHDWGEWVTVKEPTATEPGLKERTCKTDASHKEQEVIPAIGEPEAGEKGMDISPDLTVINTVEPDAGKGKRYVGAEIEVTYTRTNTGDCPVYVSDTDSGTVIEGIGHGAPVIMLDPGESDQHIWIATIDEFDVEYGIRSLQGFEPYWYYDEDGNLTESMANVDGGVSLTYPEGEEPGEKKAELEALWVNDRVSTDSVERYTTFQWKLNMEDSLWSYYDVVNTGDVPLEVRAHFSCGGSSSEKQDVLAILAPGEKADTSRGFDPVGEYITPGSETGALLGTVDITFWATGHDPNTGEQLCESKKLTHKWEVAKPGTAEWMIPEESQIILRDDSSGWPVKIEQMFEAVPYICNEGPVDIPEFTVHSSWEHAGYQKEATNHYNYVLPAMTEVFGRRQNGDMMVGINGIAIIPECIRYSVYITWIDPDSGELRESNHLTYHWPVISETGLLLEKGIGAKPKNGSWFEEGEAIKWTLTVTNNSDEPVSSVTVTDQGEKIAYYDVIAPGEKKTCSVPEHVVTAYEADITSTVVNIAQAVGTDLSGEKHTWVSNPVSVPTNGKSPTPLPPITPPTDPGGDTVPFKPIDPSEDHKDPGEGFAGDGGDACRLTLNALGEPGIRCTLYTCTEHSAAAAAAEAASAGGQAEGWKQAADIWRAEIDKTYQALYDAANEQMKAAVTADQEAWWAYANAFEALYAGKADAQKALAEMLRLHCARLCCILHTAPEKLPDSMLGEYAAIAGEPAEKTGRTVSSLTDSESEVAVELGSALAEAMGQSLLIVGEMPAGYEPEAFIQAQSLWKMTLDRAVNPDYKAAGREERVNIAAWRMALDRLAVARRELLGSIYTIHDEITEECVLDLYRGAAIDYDILR